jgi:predicted amidophosphoribosyltransferase
MKNTNKKICPQCNYLGKEKDKACPYCGIELISACPQCGAQIRVAFAEYCYACGYRFEDVVKRESSKRRTKGDEKNTKIQNA